MARRSYGSGSLTVRRGKWFGQWRVGGSLVGRVLGPIRKEGTREGLTRAQAEQELRRRMEVEGGPPVPVHARLSLVEAGERYIRYVEALGRRRSTVQGYESTLRVHLARAFAGKTLDKIEPDDLEAFIARQRRAGRSSKSIVNYLTLLQSILTFAQKRGWLRGENPCRFVDRPRIESNEDIHFLDQEELEAVLAVEPKHDFDPMLRVLYATYAMAGLRLGELRALRWRDVDWVAARVRVRRNYVRGEYGRPKSKRSSRSVPLADRLAGELERHFQASAYQGDDDLVFGNPQTGKPLSASIVEDRFRWRLDKAEVRRVRVHDLRHTFGTRMAAAGVPMRTLQEWMGHRDFKTTLIYADYQPSAYEGELAERAFPAVINSVINLSETKSNQAHPTPLNQAKQD
jgi:integrase